MRTVVVSLELLLTFAAALNSQRPPALDLKLGTGAFTILSGDKYGNPVFSYDHHLPAVGLDAALRWHRGEMGSIGIAVQWVRFGFADTSPYNASFGLALERLTTTDLCTNEFQTRVWPCSFEGSTDSGGWFKVAAGVAVPLGGPFTLESSLSVNGVVMGSGPWGLSTDDESYWLSLNVAVASVVL